MTVYRIYHPYCRKKDFRDLCVKEVEETDELGKGEKILQMVANTIGVAESGNL